MALANLGWGYTKIRDALRTGLKIEIGRTTVVNTEVYGRDRACYFRLLLSI